MTMFKVRFLNARGRWVVETYTQFSCWQERCDYLARNGIPYHGWEE